MVEFRFGETVLEMDDEEINYDPIEDDSDADAYDKYRDDESERLYEALKELFVKFVDADTGYYRNHPDKFYAHSMSNLKEICKLKEEKT